VSGRYFDEFQKERRAAPVAYDITLQEALWDASERWVRESRTGLAPS
jgi:hypothetical protein